MVSGLKVGWKEEEEGRRELALMNTSGVNGVSKTNSISIVWWLLSNLVCNRSLWYVS